MTKNLKTLGIVLSRTNYKEADRIITFLTPDYGKVSVIAKGVRKQESKLAGGIELFSISHLNLVRGRGELFTLTGSRLAKHFGTIINSLERTEAAYEMLKLVNKATEDAADPGYFILVENGLAALDEPKIELDVVNLWFRCRLIRLSGHAPNLSVESEKGTYNFDFDQMAFQPTTNGRFNAAKIKFLRLNFGSNQPRVINRIVGSSELAKTCLPLANSILQTFIRS